MGNAVYSMHSALFWVVWQTKKTKGHSLIAAYGCILGPVVCMIAKYSNMQL